MLYIPEYSKYNIKHQIKYTFLLSKRKAMFETINTWKVD